MVDWDWRQGDAPPSWNSLDRPKSDPSPVAHVLGREGSAKDLDHRIDDSRPESDVFARGLSGNVVEGRAKRALGLHHLFVRTRLQGYVVRRQSDGDGFGADGEGATRTGEKSARQQHDRLSPQ